MSTTDPTPETESTPAEFLLVGRSGATEGQTFRLAPGEVTTLGRSPTNRVVVSDDLCSRHHCELFFQSGRWVLRDAGSRNGTRLEGQLIECDTELRIGQTFQIGSTMFALVRPVGFSMEETSGPVNPEQDTSPEIPAVEDLPANEKIIARRKQTRFADPPPQSPVERDRTSQALTRLYRMAMEMAAAQNSTSLAETVLDSLLAATVADIGAAMLLVPGRRARRSDDFTIAAYRGGDEAQPRKVSDTITRLVCQHQEAILAHDIAADDRLAERSSLGEMRVMSLIAAPVRMGQDVVGLIHLYSTNPDNPLDSDDLEFTLAVADQFAVALAGVRQFERLATGLARVESENRSLREQLTENSEIIGDTAATSQLRRDIQRIAATDAAVLIRGESGVGKELVARRIHAQSPRRQGPFITMNCAALTESLLESELFGHEKGSFTGAVGRKPGKFEQAHRGTLFLDEVGEMSPAIQAKFLRVLEGHPFERVGGSQAIVVDVRVVAATNRNLEDAVASNQFRQDLYFRLQVMELFVVPLRERAGEIPLLATYFLGKLARKMGRPNLAFAPQAMDVLVKHSWPGNVRELQNTVERTVILSQGTTITADDIRLSALGARPAAIAKAVTSETADFSCQTLDELEQRHIHSMLEFTRGNKSQAAQLLGIERSTLDRKLKRYEEENRRRQAP